MTPAVAALVKAAREYLTAIDDLVSPQADFQRLRYEKLEALRAALAAVREGGGTLPLVSEAQRPEGMTAALAAAPSPAPASEGEKEKADLITFLNCLICGEEHYNYTYGEILANFEKLRNILEGK